MSEMIMHDDRDTIIAGLREQLSQAREELVAERAKDSGIEEGVAQLRQALAPLKDGLDRIFGILPASTSLAPSPAKHSAVWESWKQKMSGTAAKAIDALLLHGSMSAGQLRIHLGCATRTCTNIISELNRARIINRDGGKISLKEL